MARTKILLAAGLALFANSCLSPKLPRRLDKNIFKSMKSSVMNDAGSLGIRTDALETSGIAERQYRQLVDMLLRHFSLFEHTGKGNITFKSSEKIAEMVVRLASSLSRKDGLNEWNFLSEALSTKIFSCKNLCITFFDVLNVCSLDPKIAFTRGSSPNEGHVFLVVGDHCIEPDLGIYYPKSEMHARHPDTYLVTGDLETLMAMSYTSLGWQAWQCNCGKDGKAQRYSNLAVAAALPVPEVHLHASIYYSNTDSARSKKENEFYHRLMGNKGICDPEMAIVIGDALAKDSLYYESAGMFLEAFSLDSGNVASYNRLRDAFSKLGFTRQLFNGRVRDRQGLDFGGGFSLKIFQAYSSCILGEASDGINPAGPFFLSPGKWEEHGNVAVLFIGSRFADYSASHERSEHVIVLSKPGAGGSAHLMNSP